MGTDYERHHADWVKLNDVKWGDKMRVMVRPTPYQSGWRCKAEVSSGIQPGIVVTIQYPFHPNKSGCGLVIQDFSWAHLPFFCLVKIEQEL